MYMYLVSGCEPVGGRTRGVESFTGSWANSTSVSASLVRVVSMVMGFPLVVVVEIGVFVATKFCSEGRGRGVTCCGITGGGGEMKEGEGWEGVGLVFFGGATPPVRCCVRLAMLLRESAR